MEAWLQDVSKDTNNHLKPVFDIVTTVKTIHNIKSEAYAMGNHCLPKLLTKFFEIQ